MIKSPFLEYLKELAELDEPLGDFASDVFRDKGFPAEKTEKEMISYLELKASMHGNEEVFKELIKKYKAK